MKEQLQEHIAAHGYTQSQIAAKLGVSAATVNQYLQGKYKGDTAALDKKVEQLLARSVEKAKEVKIGFVATDTAQSIMEAAGLTHAMGDIYLVIGDAGLGKTMALREYAARHTDVIFIEVEPTYSPKVLLQAIAAKLGLQAPRNNHDAMAQIVEKLKGSERLLIIDEAELLAYKALEILRRIHDLTGIGIVLAGMPRLRANLRGARGEYKQLYSRIGFALDLHDALPEADIAMMAESYLGTGEHNALLHKVSGGNARRLAKLLKGAAKIAENYGTAVDGAMIERMAGMLIH